MNQEVLLKPQLLLSIGTVNQRYPTRGFLICLLHVVQKRRGAVKGHFHLTFTHLSTVTLQDNRRFMWIKTCAFPFPRHTCMLRWGCSTRGWLSPVGGLLEGLGWAWCWGLSTINGGWVPSLKCKGISEVLFSWKISVTSKSSTTTCGTKKTGTIMEKDSHEAHTVQLRD